MAKYKVGDKVVVRDDLIVGDKYSNESGFPHNNQTFVRDMEKLKGKVVEIRSANERFYKIKDNYFNWTDEMFKGIYKEKKESYQEKINLDVHYEFKILVDHVIHNDPATVIFYRTPLYYENGLLKGYSNMKKSVAKCNKDIDVYDKQRGFKVAFLKAIKKEAEKVLSKM